MAVQSMPERGVSTYPVDKDNLWSSSVGVYDSDYGVHDLATVEILR